MKVATWNVEWAEARPGRGLRVASLMASLDCEVIVVTEGTAGVLPPTGHIIDAGGSWGYGHEDHRRKVLAWSRQPWRDVTRLQSGAGLGRVVAGTTDTSLGPVRIVAVCIPWRDCHVRTGRRNASPWSEHLECCAQIRELLEAMPATQPFITLGDFNQRIPRHRSPENVAAALTEALCGQVVWTAGTTEVGMLIDHIVSAPPLVGSAIEVWQGHGAHGKLSDHSGVAARFQHRPALGTDRPGRHLTE